MNEIETSESAILARAIAPEVGGWSPAVAQSLLEIKLTNEDLDRADELARKAVEGTLTAEEMSQLDNYRHAGRVVELLRAKARVSLKKAGAA